jgi:hypothetical protein
LAGYESYGVIAYRDIYAPNCQSHNPCGFAIDWHIIEGYRVLREDLPYWCALEEIEVVGNVVDDVDMLME